jgi:hypothetical membrane protein
MAESGQTLKSGRRAEQVEAGSRLNRRLALGGMVGTLSFLPVAFLIGESRDGYSHLAHRVSALSQTGAPEPWAQTINFIVAGILVMGLAIGLRREMSEGRAARIGPALIAAFGLAIFLNGVFPADPLQAPDTLAGTLHSTTAGLGFLGVIAAMFLLSGRFAEGEEWQHLASLSRLAGVATIVLMVSYLMAQEGAVAAWNPWTGLLQRGMVAVVMAWLFLLALRLFQTSGRRGSEASKLQNRSF